VSLEGVRVGLTASRARCEALSFLLEDAGADLCHLPLLELHPPEDPRPFASIAEQLQRYKWILLSSLEAVAALWEASRVAGTLGLLQHVGLIATDARTAGLLEALGQPPKLTLDATGALQLDTDTEVLVPVGDGDSPWPARLAQQGALAISVLGWRASAPKLPTFAPELIVFDAPGTAEAMDRDHPQWLRAAKRVAGSPRIAQALARVGAPAHTVAGPGPEALLDAAQSAWTL
jgi:uroporphyrinogen-III synthase